MNTVLVRYGHSVRTKQYTKIRSESRDIDKNDIVQRLGETFGIFQWLAAEWRRIAFVYDVIGNMAIATSVDARGNSSQNGIDNFSSGISRKWPKIATSNVKLSRTADGIDAKFCMTVFKIKPNDIFQNCVHSCSPLRNDITLLFIFTYKSTIFLTFIITYMKCILMNSKFRDKCQGSYSDILLILR